MVSLEFLASNALQGAWKSLNTSFLTATFQQQYSCIARAAVSWSSRVTSGWVGIRISCLWSADAWPGFSQLTSGHNQLNPKSSGAASSPAISTFGFDGQSVHHAMLEKNCRSLFLLWLVWSPACPDLTLVPLAPLAHYPAFCPHAAVAQILLPGHVMLLGLLFGIARGWTNLLLSQSSQAQLLYIWLDRLVQFG